MHITERVQQLKKKAAALAQMNPFMAASAAKELLSETTEFLEQVTRHVTEMNEAQQQISADVQLLRRQIGGLINQ